MRQIILAGAASLLLGLGAATASAATLELALVIDGSSSIDESEWQLQIDAYESIFVDDFYTNFVVPSAFDEVYVAAYFFSGGFTWGFEGQPSTEVFVFSVLDWTLIDDDDSAAAFGAQFAGVPQPDGTTATAEALSVAAAGGTAGCPAVFDVCNIEEQAVTGIANNGIDSDAQVIDISTDGQPTEPNGGGSPNAADDALAIAAADAARALGITVNAIGVQGDGLDVDFLNELVGADPLRTPAGFALTASSFDTFEATLRDKLRSEIVPVPASLPLFLSALAGLGYWRRRAARRRAGC